MDLTEEQIENFAKIAHDCNKSFCETIGDDSQQNWEDCSQAQKDSAIAGVKFHASNPNSKAEDSHLSWFKQKKEDGWVYGLIKIPDLKQHPCMVPFESLPEEEQMKDHLFKNIVDTLVFTKL